ncbi:hypothetical protein [Roseibacillus ishigakijimensis]|uniref:Uncharacterized protein n=1 Tax=Roseibacillus ishigakijimensis TaxID=454146 RepID=A0A934RQC7_9BACT|nr:hypothetical protein [Roseibacillus ishigakijimensis]MBK1834998.1 hypothetical protein [Roseibacillus ishigakijimensis]
MQKGITNTLEVFEAVESTANAVEEAAADGFAISDLVHAFEPFEAVKHAIADVDEIDDELADLDEQEIRELASAGLRSTKAILDAVTAAKEALAK